MTENATRSGARGACLAIVLSIPTGGLIALLHRFPIPFVGYDNGFPAVGYAMVAVVFYGFLGGFALLGILGHLVGVLISKQSRQALNVPWRSLIIPCLAIDTVQLLILANLDKMIGPW